MINNLNHYENIFDVRGSCYDDAMRQYPNARDLEFKQLVDSANFRNNLVIVDVPAGGRYLQNYLPQCCDYRPYEPCASFLGDKVSGNLLPLPFSDNIADIAFSLAGVHHIEDKLSFFDEVYRVVKQKGQFVLSDVEKDTPTALFLDEYVGKHNKTGHDGIYLNENTYHELEQVGWYIETKELIKYHWCFNNEESMALFCNSLFDLKSRTLKQTLNAIESYLGIDSLDNGKIGMRWSLRTICSHK